MSEAASLPIIGLDIAKNVFQVHQVDSETGEIGRRQIRRAKVVEFFGKLAPSLVAMEACGGAHHWARVLIRLGHKVKLLPAQHVKAFLLRDKTDALDAQAIWIAAQQKHLKEVAVKSELQQACLTLQVSTSIRSPSRLNSSMTLKVRNRRPDHRESDMKSQLQLWLGWPAASSGCLMRAGSRFLLSLPDEYPPVQVLRRTPHSPVEISSV